MTSETDKCGISSILPISCRERAEAFAKHLNSRLQKLGSQDGILINNDGSWLREEENTIATSQPKSSDNGDAYYEFRLTESPDSPVEEKNELTNLLNDDEILKKYNEDDGICLDNMKISNSIDSDSSDGPYYEAVADDKVLLVNSTDDYVDCKSSTLLDNSLDKTDDDSANISFDSLTQCEPLTESEENNCLKLPELTLDTDTDIDKQNDKEEKDDDGDGNNHDGNNFDGNKDDVNKNDDDDDDITPIPRVRRCSSLKTGKTPPGTPGRKKIVRFADVLGLDLADVRTYLDEIPKVPNSAYNDLECVNISRSCSDDTSLSSLYPIKNDQNATKILIPMFQQPGGQTNFLDIVKDKNVCLDNVMVEDPVSFAIKGTVRVRNLDYHKSVHIRYTIDSWKSYSDLQATYVQNSCDGFSDKFTFLLYAHTLNVGERLEFAVRFQAKGCQYWDNNFGANYCFQCLPVSNNNNNNNITTSLSYRENVPMDDKIGAAFY